MRLVGHQQMLVEVEDALIEGDRLFVGHFAKIVDAQTDLIRMSHGQWLSVSPQHPATGKAVAPGGTVDGRKVIAKAVEHRAPVALGQMQRAAGIGSGHRIWRSAQGMPMITDCREAALFRCVGSDLTVPLRQRRCTDRLVRWIAEATHRHERRCAVCQSSFSLVISPVRASILNSQTLPSAFTPSPSQWLSSALMECSWL